MIPVGMKVHTPRLCILRYFVVNYIRRLLGPMGRTAA